jgi:hypothetical protein
MGRPKTELRKIHCKKVKKVKEKVKLFLEGKISYENLNKLAKRMLEKRKRSQKSI